ncbi:hypothetical protein NG799_00460 [Laspinema sp. D1]|uniref:Uncharacterized protein n=1 Tax=Laspinema palackyanum D2a TaxID=2953684 RepID=A0ABT2MJ83_9CYAN|nr:hypothetical protein [Laspinema sp. D2b]MCT7964799.1 hypothetical protein [Laspinema sp. D2a]
MPWRSPPRGHRRLEPLPINHPIETGDHCKPDPKSAIAPSCPIFQHLH